MRVLVCGGRDFSDRKLPCDTLDALAREHDDQTLCVVHGMADGADALAGEWARSTGHWQMCVRAMWEEHGKKAGPLRNQRMLDEAKPHLVLAFPGGRGTADLVRRAEAAGVPVRHIQLLPVDSTDGNLTRK